MTCSKAFLNAALKWPHLLCVGLLGAQEKVRKLEMLWGRSWASDRQLIHGLQNKSCRKVLIPTTVSHISFTGSSGVPRLLRLEMFWDSLAEKERIDSAPRKYMKIFMLKTNYANINALQLLGARASVFFPKHFKNQVCPIHCHFSARHMTVSRSRSKLQSIAAQVKLVCTFRTWPRLGVPERLIKKNHEEHHSDVRNA